MNQRVVRAAGSLAGAGLLAACSGCAAKLPASSGPVPVAQRPDHGLAREVVPAQIAEPTGVVTLRQALTLALARNLELAVSAWEPRISEARALQAGLYPNPEAGVEVENVLGSGPFEGAREAETTLELSQQIVLGGKRGKAVASADLSHEVAEWEYEMKRLEVVWKTAGAFFETLGLQRQLELDEEEVNLAEEVVAAVSKRVEAARTFEVEQTRAEVALAAARIERERTRARLEAARRRLAAAWGSGEPRFERVEGDLEKVTEVPPREELLQRVRNNPELARRDAEIRRREAELRLERARRIPDVTLAGGYRRLNGPDENAFVAGISIPLPIFSRNQGQIREAEYQLARALEESRAAELRLRVEAEQAWHRLSASAAEVEAIQEKVLPGARKTFDTVGRYYREGRVSYLEVLDAQRTLFAAREQHLRALNDYHQAVLEIERLIGGPLDRRPAGPGAGEPVSAGGESGAKSP